MGSYFIVVVSALVSMASGAGPMPAYSTDLENELRQVVFTNYTVLQRPAKQVNVSVTLNLLTVNDLNIREQKMSISAYFSLNWEDSRLNWAQMTTDYSMIPFLFSTQTHMWRPALLIDNAVDDIEVLSDVNIPMRIIKDGQVTWNPAGIFIVACESDITYYPLDIQLCPISLTSWAYTKNEIALQFADENKAVDLSSYSKNGEWELIQTYGVDADDLSRDGQSFGNLKFMVKMRRRPTYHILNTLFPVALMAVLSAMVFKLPAESGEKIGYGLTVLLAYAVYLTLISDNIPSTSIHVCYLSVYLVLILSYGTLSVLCTILVLNIYHRPKEEEIPNWLDVLTRMVLMKIGCWGDHCCCFRPKRRVDTERSLTNLSTDKHLPQTNTDEKTPIEDIVYRKEEELTWQLIAQSLDRFFFVLFICLIALSSLIIFSLLFSEFANIA